MLGQKNSKMPDIPRIPKIPPKRMNVEYDSQVKIQWSWKITLDEVVDIEQPKDEGTKWIVVQDACNKANTGIISIEFFNVNDYQQSLILPKADAYVHYVTKPSDTYSIYCVGYIINDVTTMFKAHEDGYIAIDVHPTTDEEKQMSIPRKK